MYPRNNRWKGVVPGQPSRGGRGEASSSWPQQERPNPPVLGQIPTGGLRLWDQALRDEPRLWTMDAHTLEALYLPGSRLIPTDVADEAVRIARQMQAMEEGRVAASRPLEAPAPAPPPPPQVPQPHQQFGPQQNRFRASEAYSSGGHISSFDAGADARRLARSSRANPYHQPPAPEPALCPPMAPSSHTANSSTSQQLYTMDPRTWMYARDSPNPAYIPSTDFDPFPRGDPSSSRQQQQQRYAPPTAPPPPPRFVPQRYAVREPPINRDSRLEAVRSQLLHDRTVLEGLVMTPESSALVVQLLQEGGLRMPMHVLDGFERYAARSIMGNRQGHAVFVALLRSFLGRYVQLERIVRAVPNNVWTSKDGMAALKLLITEVRGQPGLLLQLAGRLVDERVMEHLRGNELIAHCFNEMGSEEEASKFLIGHALSNIWRMLESMAGSLCLFTCFRNAREEQYQDFVNFMLDGNAVTMAMGRHSNYFVQRVLINGNPQFRRDLVLELMKEVASLFLDQYGCYVVMHCFMNRETGSPQLDLLPLVLTACTYHLGTRDLDELVQTSPGNTVLLSLLETGYDHARGLTLGLADKIDLLVSASVRRNTKSKMVLSYVRTLRDP
ncbi:hypothetical protein ZWY2020_007908 [Hordeum vulgare]|nr:hypothetical protein ZWY2020_007908 [Hordeum vulgare]